MQGKLVARARGAYLNRSKHLSRGSVVPAHAADSRDQAGYHQPENAGFRILITGDTATGPDPHPSCPGPFIPIHKLLIRAMNHG
jgi:hypothetical protein